MFPVHQPRRPCVVLPDPASDHPCGATSGEHTVLDSAICDECFEAIRF